MLIDRLGVVRYLPEKCYPPTLYAIYHRLYIVILYRVFLMYFMQYYYYYCLNNRVVSIGKDLHIIFNYIIILWFT